MEGYRRRQYVAHNPVGRLNGYSFEFIFPSLSDAQHLRIRQYMVVKLRIAFNHLFQAVFFRKGYKLLKAYNLVKFGVIFLASVNKYDGNPQKDATG